MDDARARRLALNEAIAREVNEAVEQLAEQWHDRAETVELICECSRDTCAERVHLPLADYHETRRDPQRFLLLDSHVDERIERRVGRAGDATVVEKIGPGRDVADETAGRS